MIKKNKNEVLVGGFVAISLGLFILLLFLKGTLGSLFSSTGEVQVVFEDIRGLGTGDPVFFQGSKAGQVSRIEFARRNWGAELPALFPGDTEPATRVLITLQLEERTRKLLRSRSTVDIDKNLTGNLSVLIREGRGELLPLTGAVLKGSSGTELTAIADRVEGILKKLDPAVEDFAALAHRLQSSGDLEGLVKDVAQMAHQLVEGIGPIQKNLDAVLNQGREILSENRGDIRTVASNLAEASGLFRKVLEKVEPAAGGIQGALTELQKAAAAVSGAIEANRPGLDSIIDDTRSAVANAANLTADVRRRPWRLLYRPSRDENDSLDLYDAAWAYNLGASELERSLRELAARVKADSGNERAQEGMRTAYRQVEESLRRHKEAEEAFWSRLKKK